MKTAVASVALSIIILILLAVNHLVNGAGCWGLQPGGEWSAMLFDIQVLISGFMICSAIYWLFEGKGHRRFFIIGLAFAAATLAIYSYVTVGWRMHTSIHNQGIENILTFLFASSVAIILGLYRWRIVRRAP